MKPQLSNDLSHVFNKFVKEIFHSSTLSLKIEQSKTNDYKFIGKGVSNRFIKEMFAHYGEEFSEKIVREILIKNMHILIGYIYEKTEMKVEFVSFKISVFDECFQVTVKEI